MWPCIDNSLWTHFFGNSEVWPQELFIALGQVILGCFWNNWLRAWREKVLFISVQKWQPEIYLKVVLLTWNFGSRPKINFYDHLMIHFRPGLVMMMMIIQLLVAVCLFAMESLSLCFSLLSNAEISQDTVSQMSYDDEDFCFAEIQRMRPLLTGKDPF